MGQSAQNRTPEKALQPVWHDAFLSALRETGVIRDACAAAKVGRRTAYDLRERNAEFAAAWDDAIQDAADLLEVEAVRRARLGVKKPVIYQGRPCGVWVDETGTIVAENTPGSRMVPLSVTEYSDTLLIFLLKGIRPEKYKDNQPGDVNEAFGALLRGFVGDDISARRAESSRPTQPAGETGGSGPAPDVADPSAPEAD